jgi:hypothetical protein
MSASAVDSMLCVDFASICSIILFVFYSYNFPWYETNPTGW